MVESSLKDKFERNVFYLLHTSAIIIDKLSCNKNEYDKLFERKLRNSKLKALSYMV